MNDLIAEIEPVRWPTPTLEPGTTRKYTRGRVTVVVDFDPNEVALVTREALEDLLFDAGWGRARD